MHDRAREARRKEEAKSCKKAGRIVVRIPLLALGALTGLGFSSAQAFVPSCAHPHVKQKGGRVFSPMPRYHFFQRSEALPAISTKVRLLASERPENPPGSQDDFKSLMQLSLPMLGILLIEPAMQLVDTACVGSAMKQAALAPSTCLLSSCFYIMDSISLSVVSFIAARPLKVMNTALPPAQLKDRRCETSAVLSAAIVLAVFAGSCGAGVLCLFSSKLLHLVGTGADLVPLSQRYLRICAPALPLVLVGTVCQGAFIAQQDAVVPLKLLVVGCMLNLMGDVFFTVVQGWGVSGVASATVAAQTFCCFALMRALRRKGNASETSVPLQWQGWRQTMAPQVICPLLRVAGVLTARSVINNASYMSITAYAMRLDSTANIAAHQITLQIWLVLTFCMEPLSVAVQSLVARDYGVDRAAAARVGRKAFHLALQLACGMGLVQVLLLATPASRLLTTDASVRVALQGPSVYIAAFSHLAVAGATMCDGCATATGKIAHVPLIFIFSFFCCISTLAVTARAGLGLPGVWLGMVGLMGGRFLGHLLLSRSVFELLRA